MHKYTVKTFKEFIMERTKMPIALQAGFHLVQLGPPSKETSQPQVTDKQIIPPAERLYQKKELIKLLQPDIPAVKGQARPPAD